MKQLFSLLLLAILIFPSGLKAEWSLEGTPFSTRDESVIALVPGMSGAAWLAWNDAAEGSDRTRVCVQRYDSVGEPQFEGHGVYLVEDPLLTSDLLGALRSGRDNLLLFYSLSGPGVVDGIYSQMVTTTGAMGFGEPSLISTSAIARSTRQGNYQVASDHAGGGWLIFSTPELDSLKLVGVNLNGAAKTQRSVFIAEGGFEASQYRITERDDGGVWVVYADQQSGHLQHMGYLADGSPMQIGFYNPSGSYSGPLFIKDSGFGGFYTAIDDEGLAKFEWFSPQQNYFYSSLGPFNDRFGTREIVPLDVDGEVACCSGNYMTDTTIAVYNLELTMQTTGWSAIGTATILFDADEWSGMYEIAHYEPENNRFTAILDVTPDDETGTYTFTPTVYQHVVDEDRRTRLHWENELSEISWVVDEMPDFPERWCWMLENECVLMLQPVTHEGDVRTYRLFQITPEGEVGNHEASLGEPALTTETYQLNPAYPNPFNATTRLRYTLPVAGEVRVSVFDLLGREVALLQQGQRTAGQHSILWNSDSPLTGSVASGVYFVQLKTAAGVRTERVVLLK